MKTPKAVYCVREYEIPKEQLPPKDFIANKLLRMLAEELRDFVKIYECYRSEVTGNIYQYIPAKDPICIKEYTATITIIEQLKKELHVANQELAIERQARLSAQRDAMKYADALKLARGIIKL
jgi:hypothetical protein